MAEGGQEKTEKPSARRLADARKKGNVAKSTDTNTAIVLFGGVLLLKAWGPGMGLQASAMTATWLSDLPAGEFTTGMLGTYLTSGLWAMVSLASPFLLTMLAVGLLVNYLQVGVLFTLEPLVPRFDKINPLTGFQRLFSRRSFVEVGKSLFKMAVVGYVAYASILNHYPELANAAVMAPGVAASLVGGVAWEIAWKSTFALFLMAILDLFYQRYEYERGLKMTKQEVKDEAKQSEGDPHVKGRIRRLQREAARRRMMSEVPTATVVITNPTHYAVALRYDREAMAAPVVVAKGVDAVAQRIKAVASEAGVPLVENVPLARALHKQVELEETIPEELYAAVAEVLVMVDKLNRRAERPPIRLGA